MCLGGLPTQYGESLNRILYPRATTFAERYEKSLELLAGDTLYAHPPYYKERDTVAIVQNPRLVQYDFAVMLNRDLCEQYGGTPGVRDKSGLVYALNIPRMTAFGEICYPDLGVACAHMIESIVCGHVFTDGNKRTAWNIVMFYCTSNGYLLDPEYPEEARDAIVSLCTHRWAVGDLSCWINANLWRV